MGAAAERINAENAAEDALTADRKKRAYAEGLRLARLIAQNDPEVRSVIGFGSVYEEGRPFRTDSDIDLAIEGGDLLGAFRLTEESDYRVDIVDLTNGVDAFAEMVRSRGVSLFSRTSE